MLRQLLGSRPARSIRPRSVAASAAVHGILIAAVLASTRGTGTHAHRWNHADQRPTPLVQVRYLTSLPIKPPPPVYSEPASHKPVRATRPSRDGELQRAKTRLASLKESLAAVTDRLAQIHPALDVADVMRAADVDDAKWTAVADSELNNGAAKLSDAVRPLAPPVKDGIYTPDLVDEAASPRPGNPKPRYPEPLRAAGVEADVNVQFVVDSTGRVDEPSIKFVTHVHELFMDAIRMSLRRSRFFPARFGGLVVPQLVQQEFRFQLRDRP